MSNLHIALIDDEPGIVAVLQPVLAAAGYDVSVFKTGVAAIADLFQRKPDVVLLDLGLPDVDGKFVLKHIRERGDVPVIVISARHQVTEKIAALDEGADDYIDKPFEIGELMARVRAVTRRRSGSRDEATSFSAGPLRIDSAARSVTLSGDRVLLSPKEYAILLALARSAGSVVTHKSLLAAGWGSELVDAQYLRVYIGLLRQKIEETPSDPQLILTEPGVGYRLFARP